MRGYVASCSADFLMGLQLQEDCRHISSPVGFADDW